MPHTSFSVGADIAAAAARPLSPADSTAVVVKEEARYYERSGKEEGGTRDERGAAEERRVVKKLVNGSPHHLALSTILLSHLLAFASSTNTHKSKLVFKNRKEGTAVGVERLPHRS